MTDIKQLLPTNQYQALINASSPSAGNPFITNSQLTTLLTGYLPLAGGTMSGFLTLNANPLAALHATTKQYVDTLVTSSVVWLQHIEDPNLKDDSLNTPPVPVSDEVYIVGAAPTGAWVGLSGHAVYWNGSSWISVLGAPVQPGDRFGVAIENVYVASGGVTGKEGQIAQIVSNIPGAITYTFTIPVAGNTVTDKGPFSAHRGDNYYFNGTSWIEIFDAIVYSAGPGINIGLGNVISIDNTWFSGDVTVTIGGLTSIGAGVVTNTMLAGGIDLTTKVTGILPIVNGGSGASSANAALNNFLPAQAGNAGKFLTTDGTNTSWATVSGGSGTVTSVSGGTTGLTFSTPTTTPVMTGTLAIANGGTNSGTALVNNRVMTSVAGAIVEHSAMGTSATQAQIWYNNASGLPASSSTFHYNPSTGRLKIGASGLSAERVNIQGLADPGLFVSSASSYAAELNSTSSYSLYLNTNQSANLGRWEMARFQNSAIAATNNSGIFMSFIGAGGSVGRQGEFGTIVTDITALTMKSAFVWYTPNEVNETMVERMRLSSNAVLKLVGPVITGLVGAHQDANTANSNTVVSTVAETNFTGTGITLVIPANTLQIGDKIRARAYGIFSGNIAQTLTLRFKTGATTLLTTGARTNQISSTNVGFKIEVIMVVRTIGVGGTISCDMLTLLNEAPFADGTIVPSNGTKAFNTTVSNTLQFSAQWGTSSATNSITIENIDWEIIKAQ